MRDFLAASKSDDEQRGMHRRLVELWRSRRPAGGWDVESGESVARYISVAGVHHIGGARGPSAKPSSDDGDVAVEWLSDFVAGKQDAIPIFTARVLGAERVSQLAEAAEEAGEWWLASLRWSASAFWSMRLEGTRSRWLRCRVLRGR